MDLWDINLNFSKSKAQKTVKPETISWSSWKLDLASKSLFSFPSGQERKDHWFIALLLMAPNIFRSIIRKSLVLDLGPNCTSTQEFALRNHTHIFSSVLPVQPLQTSLCYFWLTPAQENGKPVPVHRKDWGWLQESVKLCMFRREGDKDHKAEWKWTKRCIFFTANMTDPQQLAVRCCEQ